MEFFATETGLETYALENELASVGSFDIFLESDALVFILRGLGILCKILSKGLQIQTDFVFGTINKSGGNNVFKQPWG